MSDEQVDTTEVAEVAVEVQDTKKRESQPESAGAFALTLIVVAKEQTPLTITLGETDVTQRRTLRKALRLSWDRAKQNMKGKLAKSGVGYRRRVDAEHTELFWVLRYEEYGQHTVTITRRVLQGITSELSTRLDDTSRELLSVLETTATDTEEAQ